MKKTIIARIKPTGAIKTILLIAAFVVACALTIPRHVLIEKSSSKYLVAAVALIIVIAGIWTITKMIQRTFLHGIIRVDSKNLYLGRRKIAWKKIVQIFTMQKSKESFLLVTTEIIPVDKPLIFQEDDDPTTPSDSSAYRISLSNFNLPPEKIERILNEKLIQHQNASKHGKQK
jgi:hypothetical protein